MNTDARIEAALAKLDQAGFQFDEGFVAENRSAFKKASLDFTDATLWQVLGLLQIAVREQPFTVRGGLYRGVSSGLFPGTDQKFYRQCGSRLLRLRRKGHLPYQWIVDSTRRRLRPSMWANPGEFIKAVHRSYRQDIWQYQPSHVEIFVEKDAMAAVIEPVTREFGVYLNVIRGDASETMLFEISEEWKAIEKPIHAYYLGDHDPKGLQIETSLRNRLSRDFEVETASWERLAIDGGDFASPELLGFPVKRSFDKHGKPTGIWKPYVDRYGDRCIEVDALPAPEIRRRIRQAIQSHIDDEAWSHALWVEEKEMEAIAKIRLPKVRLQ